MMRKEVRPMDKTFIEVFADMTALNARRATLMPTIPVMIAEEYAALLGRYMSSHIRYSTVLQFEYAFFTILRENQERLRTKLDANTKLRGLTEAQALEGEEVVANVSANPDSTPATDAYTPLPTVTQQNAQKSKLGKVAGLYNWKHSVGGQAYNEYLDGFKMLFRVVHKVPEEEIIDA